MGLEDVTGSTRNPVSTVGQPDAPRTTVRTRPSRVRTSRQRVCAFLEGHQLLPRVVTSYIGGQAPARGIRLHHVEGDHQPRHVHVYRDGSLIVKWDLDNQKAMKGAATRRILELIRELEAEGLL
jgi:hypothetical protein